MRKSKLVLSIVSLVCYVVAVIGLFCPFIWQIEVGKGANGLEPTGGSNNGLEAGLNFAAFPQNLPNLLVIVFVAIGFLASLIYFIIVLAKSAKPVKKKKPGEEVKEKEFSKGRFLWSMIFFGILCGFLPFLCASLTLYAYGIANDQTVIGGYTVGYFIGEGAAMSGVGALIGGICLYIPTSGLLD